MWRVETSRSMCGVLSYQRNCALNPRSIRLSLHSLIPCLSARYVWSMLFLEKHIPMVGLDRETRLLGIARSGRLRGQSYEITCEEGSMVVLTRSVEEDNRVDRSSVSCTLCAKQTKFVNLWLGTQATHCDVDSGCLATSQDQPFGLRREREIDRKVTPSAGPPNALVTHCR